MPRLHCIVIVYLVKTITINQVRRELPFGIEQGPPPLAATGILVRIFPVNFALQLTPVFGIVIQDDVGVERSSAFTWSADSVETFPSITTVAARPATEKPSPCGITPGNLPMAS